MGFVGDHQGGERWLHDHLSKWVRCRTKDRNRDSKRLSKGSYGNRHSPGCWRPAWMWLLCCPDAPTQGCLSQSWSDGAAVHVRDSAFLPECVSVVGDLFRAWLHKGCIFMNYFFFLLHPLFLWSIWNPRLVFNWILHTNGIFKWLVA